jgi:hypothetical protein
MSSVEQRIAAITDSTAHLVAQLRELDELREQIRRALLVAKSAPRLSRQNRKSTTPGVFSKRPAAMAPRGRNGHRGSNFVAS